MLHRRLAPLRPQVRIRQVVEGMVNKAGKIKVGHGLDPSVQLEPLVSKEQHTKGAGYIESGRKEGVKVETGGGVIGNQGYFVEPTVLTRPIATCAWSRRRSSG